MRARMKKYNVMHIVALTIISMYIDELRLQNEKQTFFILLISIPRFHLLYAVFTG